MSFKVIDANFSFTRQCFLFSPWENWESKLKSGPLQAHRPPSYPEHQSRAFHTALDGQGDVDTTETKILSEVKLQSPKSKLTDNSDGLGNR